MEIEKALRDYGLTENEIKVYLNLLSLGSSKVQNMVKYLDMPRTTVYNTLNLLKNKGFVSYIIKENVQTFEAVEPNKFIEKLKEKEKTIEGVLPKLMELKKILKNKPNVKVYLGLDGLKTIMNDALKIKNSKIFAMGGSGKSRLEIMPIFTELWHGKRQKEHIMFYSIYHDTTLARKRTKDYPEDFKLAEIKFLQSALVSPIVTLIYGDKVSLASWSENPFGIILEDVDIAKSYLEHFKALWKIARK